VSPNPSSQPIPNIPWTSQLFTHILVTRPPLSHLFPLSFVFPSLFTFSAPILFFPQLHPFFDIFSIAETPTQSPILDDRLFHTPFPITPVDHMSETKPQSGDVKPSFSKPAAFLGFTTATLGCWAAACAIPEATLGTFLLFSPPPFIHNDHVYFASALRGETAPSLKVISHSNLSFLEYARFVRLIANF